MCRLAGVSRSGYYRAWRQRAPKEEETGLRDAIQRLALDRRHKHYGYRRLTALLRRQGWSVNHKRVLRLMRQDNLLCLRRKAFVPATTDSRHDNPIYPNLARRRQASEIDQLWVADITYLRLAREFAYLAVVLDAFSRRVVGWAMADHLQASLAVQALEMALKARKPEPGLIHHSDRGVQYTSRDYIGCLDAWGVLPSMSRVGCPYDNAKAESFMKTLKTEEVDGRAYRDLPHATSSIGAFIEEVYNPYRLHSALGYLAPMEFEKIGAAPLAAAQQPGTLQTATCP